MAATNSTAIPSVCIFGAGSIGTYVGGRLQAAGVAVTLIGRPRLAGEVQRCGLRLTDWRGADVRLPPQSLTYTVEPGAAADADLVIVTVKSSATREAGQQLASVIAPEAVVLSLQNGMRNAGLLREALPHHTVLTGMISFNVLQRGDGHFHAGSEGELMADPHPLLAALADRFAQADLPLEQRADMPQVQWAKLLMNLNNAVNALSDLPLKEELSQRDYRRCLALMVDETLAVLKTAGIRPARLLPLPMAWLPSVLRLPDWVFTRVAQKMLAIDPLARSSMWEDLQAGRRTEIGSLNGEVVRLAADVGAEAPVNRRMAALIREAEEGGRRRWSGPELLAALANGRKSESPARR